jgi:protoheme IX farnesyltransferase
MMPVVAGVEKTKAQILIYSIVLITVSLLPYVFHMCGQLYLVIASTLGVLFLFYAWKVKNKGTLVDAKKLFWFSILYLFLLYFAMFIDKFIGL